MSYDLDGNQHTAKAVVSLGGVQALSLRVEIHIGGDIAVFYVAKKRDFCRRPLRQKLYGACVEEGLQFDETLHEPDPRISTDSKKVPLVDDPAEYDFIDALQVELAEWEARRVQAAEAFKRKRAAERAKATAERRAAREAEKQRKQQAKLPADVVRRKRVEVERARREEERAARLAEALGNAAKGGSAQ